MMDIIKTGTPGIKVIINEENESWILQLIWATFQGREMFKQKPELLCCESLNQALMFILRRPTD